MIQLRREVTYLLMKEAKGAHERAWLYYQGKVYWSYCHMPRLGVTPSTFLFCGKCRLWSLSLRSLGNFGLRTSSVVPISQG